MLHFFIEDVLWIAYSKVILALLVLALLVQSHRTLNKFQLDADHASQIA